MGVHVRNRSKVGLFGWLKESSLAREASRLFRRLHADGLAIFGNVLTEEHAEDASWR